MPKKYAVIENNPLRGRPLVIAKDLSMNQARKVVSNQSRFSQLKSYSIVTMARLKKIQDFHIFPKKLKSAPSKKITYFGRKNG